MQVDWSTLTRKQAAQRIGAADHAESLAAQRFNETGSPEDEAAWLRAFTLWEDLRVFAICGERPDGSRDD